MAIIHREEYERYWDEFSNGSQTITAYAESVGKGIDTLQHYWQRFGIVDKKTVQLTKKQKRDHHSAKRKTRQPARYCRRCGLDLSVSAGRGSLCGFCVQEGAR